MKTLWNIVSFLAVVHLLALLIFIGWLWQSQRLSVERMHELRGVLAMTVPQQQAAAARTATQIQQQHDRDVQEQRRNDPPVDSAAQIKHVSLIKQQEEQSRRRLQDEKTILLGQLAAATSELDQQRSELERTRTQWENAVRTDRQRKTDEQFLQTIKQYEQVPPKQGKKMIAELVSRDQFDMAVAYLDAMNPRAASKILREFKTDSEIALATQLLEELRTFGMDAPSTGSAAANSGPRKPVTAAAPAQESSSNANGTSSAP
jgi:hypothetical protein